MVTSTPRDATCGHDPVRDAAACQSRDEAPSAATAATFESQH